jgi:hypothetical protein
MAKETQEEHDHPDLSKIAEKVNEHIETRLEYLRLIISEKVAVAIAKAVSTGIIFILFVLFFLFVNVAAAMWIGKHYDNYAMGFGIISLFYFVLIIIYLLLRKSVFEKKMEDSIVKSLYAEHEEEDEDEE